MSHFYGYLTGNRGTATRCGSKSSGINAVLKSWHNYVNASLIADTDGEDLLELTIPEGLTVSINDMAFIKRKNGEMMIRKKKIKDDTEEEE